MKEIIPIAIGLLSGGALTLWRPFRRPAPIVAATALLGGFAASLINGELQSGAWAAFVSIDSMLVWAGMALGAGASALVRRKSSGLRTG